VKTVLVTGGAGFFGGQLLDSLLKRGFTCVSIDLEREPQSHPNLTAAKGDIRDLELLRSVCASRQFDAVFHCAAIMAHSNRDHALLWSSNVDGTRNIAAIAKEYHIPRVIFTSSNCLWGKPMGRAVREDDTPNPVEIYGRSKWEGERILLEAASRGDFRTVIFRCPTIIGRGRLGLLSILFEFIDEGRKVWVVGDGKNIYQFIYAGDLIDACVQALNYEMNAVFGIGADRIESFQEMYRAIAERARTGARIGHLPRLPAILAMKLAHALGLSPLGPYHYKMIAEDFVFDTAAIKRELEWQPTLGNADMLWLAFEYYRSKRKEIERRTGVSAHRQTAKMGLIRVLKWLS
jgi:nucleoside-diphosphate-sugar epimerase